MVGMADIVEVADQRAGDDDQRDQHRDHRRIGVGHRVVVRQHQEQHRQGDIVVVQRALLGLLAERGIWRLASHQRGNHLALVGDDDQEHVARHPGRHQGADMDQRTTAAEHLGESEARRNDDNQPEHPEQIFILAERRLAKLVIEQPAQRQCADAQRRRLQRRERHHIGIDQIEVGLGVIDPGQQHEAREPGGVGLPFVPGQLLRHELRRDHVLAHLIEAAAMHLPAGAALAGGNVR